MSQSDRFLYGSTDNHPFWRNRANKEIDITQARVGDSGNSDVDVQVRVEVDTRPVAYAMLCSLLATKQINKREFDNALENLESLINKDKRKKMDRKEMQQSQVKLYSPSQLEDAP